MNHNRNWLIGSSENSEENFAAARHLTHIVARSYDPMTLSHRELRAALILAARHLRGNPTDRGLKLAKEIDRVLMNAKQAAVLCGASAIPEPMDDRLVATIAAFVDGRPDVAPGPPPVSWEGMSVVEDGSDARALRARTS